MYLCNSALFQTSRVVGLFDFIVTMDCKTFVHLFPLRLARFAVVVGICFDLF